MKRIIVIGGGISGLSAAYFIKKNADEANIQIDLKLLESASRLGGKIQSKFIDGYLCEWGPNSIFLNKPQNVELINDLGIKDELVYSNESAKKRFLFINGKLQMLPDNPPGFMKSKILSTKAKFRILLELFTRPAVEGRDETIAEFTRRHLGEEAVRKLVDSMVTGVFAGEHTKLSIKSCFPMMLELEKEGNGSLIKAMMRRMKAKKKAQSEKGTKTKNTEMVGQMGSFKSGVQGIVDGLTENLKDYIQMDSEVVGIDIKNSEFMVYLNNKAEPVTSDIVVLAVPAYSSKEMIKDILPDESRLFDAIPYIPVNVVNFGYQKEKISHPVDGFGFLIPSVEKRRILGSVWMSSIFNNSAPNDNVLLRTMVGGARMPEIAEMDDEKITDLVMGELKNIMGIDKEPDFINIIRHEKAIPQYFVGRYAKDSIGQSERVEKIEQAESKIKGLFFTGNSLRGVALHDCVKNSIQTAEKIIAGLAVS